MAEIRLRKRRRLKRKEAATFADEMGAAFGCKIFSEEDAIDMAEAEGLEVAIVNNRILGLRYEGKPFLTVRGLLKYRPAVRFVTVDMGAIRFVTNGADIMTPGIVDADPAITAGDLVWIRDERNLQPLAVGVALMGGAEMKESKSGKGVRSLLYVGDEIWKLDD
ncbi:MAG: RNA-binding protein [Thermoplasmata archaeon HGW-Thermoplasmata-1]|nr:MAG: RNA-binding protein [Thermoplasmata archaeon HGW-Thermoplasmata-1]